MRLRNCVTVTELGVLKRSLTAIQPPNGCSNSWLDAGLRPATDIDVVHQRRPGSGLTGPLPPNPPARTATFR